MFWCLVCLGQCPCALEEFTVYCCWVESTIFKFPLSWINICLVPQLCPTLCNPRDDSLPGSSVHGILQARILEWVAIPFSRGSSQIRDGTWVSCTAGRFLTIWATIQGCSQMPFCLWSWPPIWDVTLSSMPHSVYLDYSKHLIFIYVEGAFTRMLGTTLEFMRS